MSDRKEDGKNYIHEMKLWKDRIEAELGVAAEWEENWGFLKAPKKVDQPPEGKYNSPATSPKSTKPQSTADGEEEIELTAKLRYTVNRGKTPKETQSRPITTSQEIGWRPNIELFGVAHHGIRRDPGLWPQ